MIIRKYLLDTLNSIFQKKTKNSNLRSMINISILMSKFSKVNGTKHTSQVHVDKYELGNLLNINLHSYNILLHIQNTHYLKCILCNLPDTLYINFNLYIPNILPYKLLTLKQNLLHSCYKYLLIRN